MGWIFLILTILFESTAIIFIKLSAGFKNIPWTIAGIVMYIASFIFLSLALKQLPTGIANAAWAGSSTILVAVAGIFIFKEQLSIAQILFLALIVIGLIGLNLAKPA